LHTLSEITEVNGTAGNFNVTLSKGARYIDLKKCTGCGDCAEVCPVSLPSVFEQGLGSRKATYRPYAQAVPGAYAVTKKDRSPCTQGCPNHVNAHAYVSLVAQQKYPEALAVIQRTLPLPGVIGRVCPHPCEDACRRQEVDAPISICTLKRFVADQVDVEETPLPEISPRKERVAIIGAGPAGLTAAYFLALDGFQVTIFEALPVGGGMLRVGIPDYRLPPAVLEKEIAAITRLGVEIRYNTALGRDITLDSLAADGYQAVYLAVGAHASMKLNIPDEDAEGVITGVRFLREAALYERKTVSGHVVIVGGGDVAIDAARSALRMGAEKVSILYRRTRTEMPARNEEVEDALEEGITIDFLLAPVKVVVENGKVAGLECVRMELGEPDKSGRRRPVPVADSEFVVACETIIPAIGQRVNPGFLEGSSGVELTAWGTIVADPITCETSRKGVFAGGDAQSGPWIAISAVAAGREAAVSIARYIDGADLAAGREPLEVPQRDFNPIPAHLAWRPREHMDRIPMAARLAGFAEVEKGFSAEQAVAEAAKCLNCMVCCECFECVKVCGAGALTLDTHAEQRQTESLDVGAIVLTPGFKPYDPSKLDFYGYDSLPNVVTSLAFERLLSAGGPTGGHVKRPSDGREPKRIAWLQCVGSRDLNRCGNQYCSSVCCMYAIKEAVIAKEHLGPDFEPTIFFMDMRTHGKEFEKYYARAKTEGVRFVRSRVHTITETAADGTLSLRYVTEEGALMEEPFDLVVLSVGMEPADSAVETAQKLGVALNPHRFVATDDLSPVSTSRPGIYVAGVLQGCKDIPQSVVEASAAACSAAVGLTPARGSLVVAPSFPAEREVGGDPPRVGVFVCNCGVNIGGIADVPGLVAFAKGLPHVVYAEDNLFSCSQDTQEKLVAVIREQNLNRIVVAACTPRTHEALFQETLRDAGLNPYLFEMANIRNQCTWVHSGNKDKATDKARDLIRMAVARATLLEPIPDLDVAIEKSALVVGGGVAGMTAALGLADQGFPTVIVEKAAVLGGAARDVRSTRQGQDVPLFLEKLVARVEQHPAVTVLCNAEVTEASGFVGNFETTVVSGEGARTVKHGATIIATGAQATDTDEYLYGKHPRVTRWHDLEQHPERLEGVESVVFVQCVGSRDDQRPYCSRICCTSAVKQAIWIRGRFPAAAVYILYRDIRTFGEAELLYKQARELGVIFIRYSLERKPVVRADGERLKVEVFDPVLQRALAIPADYLNLMTAVEPPKQTRLAEHYKLPLTAEGFFMEAHAKLRPVDFATDGIFVCGLAHYPKPLEESIAQALAAAGRATTVLARDAVKVSPLVSQVDAEKCIGCGLCAEICPFSAIEMMPVEGKGLRARNIPASCKGCGLCAASCPQRAIDMLHFRDQQIIAAVAAVV
jgi:heterodisulfide reductase subunit A-like polyferredoxin